MFGSWTPYQYGYDSPIRFVDVMGMANEGAPYERRETGYDGKSAWVNLYWGYGGGDDKNDSAKAGGGGGGFAGYMGGGSGYGATTKPPTSGGVNSSGGGTDGGETEEGGDEIEGNGPGDPPAKGSEFNITFSFGMVASFNLFDLINFDARVWTFGEVGTKTDFSDEEWNDRKITSEHSITGGIGSLTFGRGFEHRIGRRPSGAFYDTHPKDIYTAWGKTTKVDRVTGEQKADIKKVIFGMGLGIFSFEITKDPR